jgi:hypothetical protein
MRSLLGFFLIFFVIGVFLLALGAAIGGALHWTMPAVDLGVGILIGVITIGFTAQLFARIISLPLPEIEDEPETIEPAPRERIAYLIDPTPPRRRGKRRPS